MQAARMLFAWGDKDNKGYLEHIDFRRILPADVRTFQIGDFPNCHQMVDHAFAFFDKVGDHRVNKADWEDTFKALMSERANLSRTITDQEKCEAALSLCAFTNKH